MNQGSTRITIRVGDELLDLVDEALHRRNEKAATCEEWNRTDFIIEAIKDKLNHGHRSRRSETQVEVVKLDPYVPRKVEVTE